MLEELNNPEINDLYFSRIQYNPLNLKMMNLTFTVNNFSNIYRDSKINKILDFKDDTFFVYGLITWLLSLSCSLISKHRESNFKLEYIIPQMTLELITNDFGFDGIKYFSTKIDYPTKQLNPPYINLALPARSFSNKGLCKKLVENIELTEPKNIKDLNLNETEIDKNEINNWMQMCPESFIQEMYSQRKKLDFNYSIFSKIEIELCKLETKKI